MAQPCLRRTIGTLDELAELVAEHDNLFVRWSAGPSADANGRSRDELTGIELPGLSASTLQVEPWWDGRPLRLWVARRLYDYHHLARRRPDAKPWVLLGQERGRGPDNEPLVECLRPVGWVGGEVVDEAARLVEDLNTQWGSLDRGDDGIHPARRHSHTGPRRE